MTIIKLSDIWQWSKNNYLFFVFLPVIFLHLPNLPQWVFLAYLGAWVIALPKLQSQKLFRIFYFFKFNLVTAVWVAYLNQILADDLSKISHRKQVDISKFRRGIPNN